MEAMLLQDVAQAVDEIERLQRLVAHLRADIEDMYASPQTLFIRCPGCHRLHSSGLICPTNAAGGRCEAGR